MKCINYKKAVIKNSTLDALYNGEIGILDENLVNIINTEAPITLNILKARLRESYNVGKISQKALDIILEEIKKFGFKTTDNFYDVVYWPSSGIFNVDYLREGYPREIYDIPYQEMKNLVDELNFSGEELYREILKYYGFQVLTKKANDYLEFIEKKCR